MKLKKRKLIFVILIIVALVAINFKSIGRMFYPLSYETHIKKYSKEYDINPYLVAAVIKVESNFEKEAISKKNARGLMQLTPSTAKWAAEKIKIDNFDVAMLFDPETNIRMGCWYINDLRREFGPDMKILLAAYNGGRGNVKKWLKDEEHSKDGKNLDYIPFKETDEYVKKVEVNYNIYKYLYGDEGSFYQTVKMVLSRFFK